jgi:hypothetical protein
MADCVFHCTTPSAASMTRTGNSGGRGRNGLKTAARVGGLVVASSLISGAALAKDEKKSKAVGDHKSTMAAKVAPNSAMAMKQQPAGPVPINSRAGSGMCL